MQVIFTEERQKETRSTAEYSHIPQAAGYRGRGQGEARMEVIKWDGVTRAADIARVLIRFISEEDRRIARAMAYGDFGKHLKKRHGGCFHGGSVGDNMVESNSKGVTVAFDFLDDGDAYTLTWNKAAKLICEHIYDDEDDDDDEDDEEEVTDVSPIESPKEYMTDKAQEAFTVHAQIMLGAQVVENGLYQMAKGFKIMRDEKLYKQLGYDSFEKYCEVETGIKRAMVYRYIGIIEKAPPDLSNRLDKLGFVKVELLAKLDDEQRAEIVNNTDIESTTVKELRDEINRITGRSMLLEQKAAKAEATITEQDELIQSLRDELKESSFDIEDTIEYKEMQDEIEHHKERISQYSEMLADEKKRRAEKDEQITRLMGEIRELEKRPIEVQGLDESQRRTLEFDIKFRAAAEYVRLAGEAVCGNDERERFLNLKALIDEVLSKKK